MNKLGLNPFSLIAQVVNFTILFLVLKKLFFDLIINIAKKQKKNLKETEERELGIKKEWENINEQKTKEIAKARKESSSLLSDARKEADNQKREIIDSAKTEAREIIQEARTEIENRKKESKEEVKDYAASIAVETASKIIANYLGKVDHKVLIKKSIASLKEK